MKPIHCPKCQQERNIAIPTTCPHLWHDDLIQFARLLCEINANIVATSKEWRDLAESMDLSFSEICELFNRAEDVWERSKKDNL